MADYRIIERDVRDQLGEGLYWSPRDNAVYWTDIIGKAVHRLSFGTGAIASWSVPEMVGWVIERENKPGFIAGFQSGFVELELEPLAIRPIHNPHPHLPGNRMNDAKADRHGRIWAGSMHVDADRPTGAFHRLDPDFSVHKMDDGYTVANGPALSPDQTWLYHTDTELRRIYRFALHDDGSLDERSVFIEFQEDWGYPDGMTVDSEGGLWVAHWGGGRVSRFSADGTLERSIHLPASQITNVVFAGENFERMFVTSAAVGKDDEPLAGSLFEVNPGVRGLPCGRFGG
ncbi:SMP-30/gluconolactonase/LRE family protein [Pedomonas mirosovicensis]|uniref:SMP-30/gluconolactonase/LRE family protein n=1 Tax=Pedomonas mirosovicensis TaxID=2908641 RepID=UPI002166FAE6|nr:SMP-30/gluconolactonase/LRE family protein [Pedomonas mirosovicensis]MCH8686163.1 SMP-30/gluconolactonase/LRE family protein [Pedomonas mirosovicensis]MCH8686805.1 SMP-30/gluconolactonase/LRE family protein [Pedomonas mirosovicensis]